MTRDEAIRAWLQAKQTAAQWAEYERNLRDQLVSGLFTDKDGTQHQDLGNGYGLKLLRTSRIKVDPKPALFGAFQVISANHADEAPQLKELLSWKPDTTLGKWKAATPAVKHYLSPFVTITPNSPQLTFEEPTRK